MVASIPASEIVSILPSVLNAGGDALQLSGLFLTNSTRVPIGTVISLGSAAAVQSYFGPASDEAAKAAVYFAGYDGSTAKPGAMLFSQYNSAAVSAYLRGGSLAGLTLPQLQALTGTLIVTVDGTVKTSSTINLSAATSFSNAATLIQAAFTTPGFTVTFDSVSNAFLFTDTSTGATSVLSFATGTLATSLALTQATGAVTSVGAVAATPTAAMNAIMAQTVNWATFTTLFEAVTADCVAFAAWTNTKNNRFAYIMWDSDAAPTTASDTSSAGYLIQQAGYSGTVPVYDPTNGAVIAAFLMGAIASIDFTAVNGRTNLAFVSQSGLMPGVSNQIISENLLANGYDFYGRYATAAQPFTFFYDGGTTGPFAWLDSYVNQIWLNNALQLVLMELLTTIRNIPYNQTGYGLIETAMLQPVLDAVNFGAIQQGVVLSTLQAEEVNTQAGRKIDDALSANGYYILVADPGAQVRGNRGSPNIILWYCDGGSVQRLTVSSVLVQ